MKDLGALVLFALVSSGTPGPNNALLWASGLQFGFRATVPQIIGTSAGIGILAVAVAAGLGAVLTGLPEVELALKLVGSVYLLFLAFQLAGGAALQRAQITDRCACTKPPPFSSSTRKHGCSRSQRSARFGRRTSGRDRERDRDCHDGHGRPPHRLGLGRGGTALHRLTARRRGHRALNGALALLLALSIAFIWI